MVSNNASVNAQKASELLSWLAAVVDEERRRNAEALGECIATRVAMEWAGQNIYFPIDRPRRNREIYAQFNGQNYHELARKFHLSERQARAIVSAEQERRRIRQNVLPGLEGGEE